MRTQLLVLSKLATLATLTALAGCGGNPSVSESQCIAGDWQTVGYRDGVNGLRSTQLLQHQDACVQHNVMPNRADYMIGWKEGVGEYCLPGNGFAVGEGGSRYYNVCPAGLDSDFQAAYKQGRKLYLARAAVSNVERKLYQREARLEVIKAEIVSSAAGQLDPTLLPAERIELGAYTARLAEEKARIEHELPELEQELSDKTAELDAVTHTLAQVSY